MDTPRELRGKFQPNSPEIDHIIPLSRGGAHSVLNCACACRKCNGDKGNSMPGFHGAIGQLRSNAAISAA